MALRHINSHICVNVVQIYFRETLLLNLMNINMNSPIHVFCATVQGNDILIILLTHKIECLGSG